MDETMIDLTAGDMMLRRRLEAYAEDRLSPDLTTSSRLRARVLAVAHRQADLARADAALMVLPGAVRAGVGAGREHLTDDPGRGRPDWAARGRAGHRPGSAWRRTASILMAATLGFGLITGTALAARPGGPLYPTRIWAETLMLPSEPSERALAELERLDARLLEAATASAAGDTLGAAAALRAYEAIVAEATAAAIDANDSVAGAVLEAGVGQNLVVLQALAARVPDVAGAAIDRAIERAIDRSGAAIDAIDTSKPTDGGPGDDGGSPGGQEPRATPRPTRSPKPEPAVTPRPTPRPTPKVTPKPASVPTQRPTAEPPEPGNPDPPSKPSRDPGKPGDGESRPTPRGPGG